MEKKRIYAYPYEYVDLLFFFFVFDLPTTYCVLGILTVLFKVTDYIACVYVLCAYVRFIFYFWIVCIYEWLTCLLKSFHDSMSKFLNLQRNEKLGRYGSLIGHFLFFRLFFPILLLTMLWREWLLNLFLNNSFINITIRKRHDKLLISFLRLIRIKSRGHVS